MTTNTEPKGELLPRALAAYYRSGETPGAPVVPPKYSGVVEHDGKEYVVLRNIRGRPLAVYRVRTSGVLKRLARWPKEIG